MKIATAQISYDEIKEVEFDLVIACSGYEPRASYFFKNYAIHAKNKYCIGFKSNQWLTTRKQNDRFFKELGFSFILAEGRQADELEEIFVVIKKHLDFAGKIQILIDYSSMARIWYASLIAYLRNLSSTNKSVSIFFNYSKAKFKKPKLHESYTNSVDPLPGYYSIGIPYQPTALIIGLGYFGKQSFGLAEYFDAETYLFISRNDEDDQFYGEVSNENEFLIKNVNQGHIFNYSLSNLEYAESLLIQLCKELQINYRIIIAPCGPKPFTLLCLIVAQRYSDIDVWRISTSSDKEIIAYEASGEILLLRCDMRI